MSLLATPLSVLPPLLFLDTWNPWALAGAAFALGSIAGFVLRNLRAAKGDPRHGHDEKPTAV